MAYSELILVGCVAVVTAIIAAHFLTTIRPDGDTIAMPSADPLCLFFDNGVLHNASTAALKHFAVMPGACVWDDLRNSLLPRFPAFPTNSGTGASGSMTLASGHSNDHATVEIKWRDGLCWVRLIEEITKDRSPADISQDYAAMASCCETMAHPAWKIDHNGIIGWQNAAYEKLAEHYSTPDGDRLFAVSGTAGVQRVPLEDKNGVTQWYEVTMQECQAGQIHHATYISSLVQAEDAQRAFVQTLAKTFAHLPIGLAIFDSRGQLGIFNPALVDLSGLQASFLATGPTMICFFDALRENRRMPEPKNYRNWRQDIADVIAAASGGQYRETWTLEDGRTYAVQGRPHPDGATAFLIEDISAEVTLSRSYRAEIEQFEALLDNVQEAFVVFSASGVLTFSNAAYRKMWNHNPEAAFADVTINDAVALWTNKTQGGADWHQIIDFTATLGARKAREISLHMPDGLVIQCDLHRLAADATLIRFSPPAPQTFVATAGSLQKAG